jgi:hypothetical protein
MTFFGIDFPFQPPGPIRQASPLRLLKRQNPDMDITPRTLTKRKPTASKARLSTPVNQFMRTLAP